MHKKHQQDNSMSTAIVAGVVGAAVATVAVSLTDKSNRDKIKKIYDQVVDNAKDLKEKANDKKKDLKKTAKDVKESVKDGAKTTKQSMKNRSQSPAA